jgi:hypothetical protein
MGDPPKGMSIDRKDNNSDYCLENCRWATNIEQANNKRTNVIITFNNKTQTMRQWADELMINYKALAHRYERGWSIERAFMTPIRKKLNKYYEY